MALPTTLTNVTTRKLGSTLNSLWTKAKSYFVNKSGDTMTGRLTLEKPVSQVITGTGTAATSSGSGSSTIYYPALWKYDLGIATPTAGDKLCIRTPVAGHDYGVFISTDNGTTYYPVARHTGKSRLTIQYPSGAYICVVFEGAVSGITNSGCVDSCYPPTGATARQNYTSGCWRVLNDYDSGNSVNQLRHENGRFYAGSTGCNPYAIVCLDKDNKFSMLTSSGSGTGTSKTINTSGKFKINPIILYYGANNTAAANARVSSTYATYNAITAIDTRYSHNHTTTFAVDSPLYIECTIDEDGFWSPTTKCITQTLETGKYYIFLGMTYSTEYQLCLVPYHPIYYYDGTNLTEVPRLSKADRTKLDGIANGATKVESSSTNGSIKINGTDTAVYTHPTQTAYTSKGSATKVPQITTDSTGHVTGITEVTITGVTPASHTHGNIANGGTLTDTAASAAGNDYVVIRDADNAKIQTSTIKGTDVADAVSKKHSHSTLTLSTTAQAYDGTHTLALPSSDPYTSARTPSSHTHGNIQNGGTLQTTDITIASGDKLVVTDSSDSNKVARASISFDGSTTTKALTPKGTWETFNNYSHPAGSAASKTGVPTADATPSFGGTFKVNQITTDATSHVSAVTERTITIPGTTATTSDKGLMSAADKTKLNNEPITKNTSDVKVFCITKPITTNWYDNQTVHLYTGYVNGTGFELIIGVRQYSATTSAPLTNLSVTLYRETPYAISITSYYKVDGSNIVLAFVFANKTTFRVTSPITDMSSNISTLNTWDETGWTALPSANLIHRYNAWKDTTSAIGSDAIPTYVAAGGQIKVCTDDFVHDGDVTSTYSSTGTAPVNGTAVAAAIGGLDVSSVGGAGKYISTISEMDGKISATATTMDTTPTANSTNAVTSGGVLTALDAKVNIANISLEGQTTTLLSKVQAMGTAGTHYARYYTKTDGGSANISDKPESGSKGFLCEVLCKRYNTASDYRYQLICWVQGDNNPYVASVQNNSTSIFWSRLNTQTITGVKGNAESSYRTGNVNLTPANLGISATSTSVTVGSTTFNQYVHPTTSGNKHVPSGGSSGQFLGYDSDGTAKWVNNPNTDTKVTQTVDTSNNAFPLLAKNTTATATITDTARFASTVTVNPSVGGITANRFTGALYNSKAYMQESSQTKSGIYLIIGSYTYTASKITPTSGDPFPRAYDNKDITFTMNSRHSGSGICVVSTQINGDNPTETSMTGVVRMYANAGASGRTSSPIYLYRSYTPNASTYTPSWTLTLVVSISDYNTFTINNVLERNGWTIKSGTIATYDSDPSNYVTEANLSTLGTRIATATFVADTDTKVTQTADNSSTGTGFEVLFSATADNTTRTEASRKSSKLTFQPSTGTLTATKFSGPLTGNVTGNCSGSSGSCTGLAAKATADANGNPISSTYLKLSGGTMTGVINTAGNLYTDDGITGAIDLKNSNIVGLNAIYTKDASESATEGINFYRSSDESNIYYDTLWIASGNIYFVPNRTVGAQTSAANSQKVTRLPASITDNQIVLTNGTDGLLKTSAASSITVGAATSASNIGVTTKNDAQIYLSGALASGYNSGAKVAQYADTGVFVTSTSGQLQATSYKVTANATIQYNSTDASLDFVFA